VPSTEDADIQLPTYHIVCHATFTDYKIVTDAAADGNHASLAPRHDARVIVTADDFGLASRSTKPSSAPTARAC